MGDTLIKYTPRGEATLLTLNCTTAFAGLRKFAGDFKSETSTSVTTGGNAYTQVLDAWIEYDVEFLRMQRSADVSLWSEIARFVSHATQGGAFSFTLDDAYNESTTTTGAVAQGDTTLALTSTSGFAAGDVVYIEDADDPSRWECNEINNPATTTVINGLMYSYPAGSIVRHFEHFPQCVVVGRKGVEFVERAAGQGSTVYDLTLQFRTVR